MVATDNKPKHDHRHLLGAPVKERILKEVRDYVSTQQTIGKLVSILIGDAAEAAVYVRNQARVAKQAGLPFDEQVWPADITQEECKAT